MPPGIKPGRPQVSTRRSVTVCGTGAMTRPAAPFAPRPERHRWSIVYLPARTGRPTALLLSASLVTVLADGLVSCSLIGPSVSCEDSEQRLKDMSSLAILDAKPPRASPPAGHTEVETAPDFGAGTGVEVLVGAEIDGSPAPCWD